MQAALCLDEVKAGAAELNIPLELLVTYAMDIKVKHGGVHNKEFVNDTILFIQVFNKDGKFPAGFKFFTNVLNIGKCFFIFIYFWLFLFKKILLENTHLKALTPVQSELLPKKGNGETIPPIIPSEVWKSLLLHFSQSIKNLVLVIDFVPGKYYSVFFF